MQKKMTSTSDCRKKENNESEQKVVDVVRFQMASQFLYVSTKYCDWISNPMHKKQCSTVERSSTDSITRITLHKSNENSTFATCSIHSCHSSLSTLCCGICSEGKSNLQLISITLYSTNQLFTNFTTIRNFVVQLFKMYP